MTTMDSQEPICCDNSHLPGFIAIMPTWSYIIRRVLEVPHSTEDGIKQCMVVDALFAIVVLISSGL